MGINPAALDLPHALVEWVTMLLFTREGDRRCKLRPSHRAIMAPARAHHPGEDRCRVRDQRVHRPLLHQSGHRPPRRPCTGPAEGPTRAGSGLRPPGRHARRVRPGRRRTGRLLPQAPPRRGERAGSHRSGRPAAVALARAAGPLPRPDRCPHPPDHPHLRAPERPHPGRSRLPGRWPLADHGHQTQAPAGTHPYEKTVNRALAAARAPVERGVACLKSWRIFRRSRCSPNRMTSVAKAILTLERQR